MKLTTQEILDRLPKEILDSLEQVRKKYSTKNTLTELAHFIATDFESRDMYFGEDFINDIKIKQALHLLTTSHPEYISYDEFKKTGKIRSSEEDVEGKLGPLNFDLLVPPKKESLNKVSSDSEVSINRQKIPTESQQTQIDQPESNSDKSSKKASNKSSKTDNKTLNSTSKLRNTPLEDSVVVRIHVPLEDYSLLTLLARKEGLTVPAYFLNLYQNDSKFQKVKHLLNQ
ncbi:hypothetical protein [Siphonobacter sp. SORGH_AS_1065]|uniref:hypothetical protein n=1 Tax=Siphonobacter sp. SORGH_AS_1065 TaxID=3041795 RepID=UPI00277F506A|nr:hypothetical protein [Siphonobacter sp. SORGH_AS_1065]MDQ1090454.1 hypothetical protein [Siphonobacter sp. SORGH_AS_1065]